jgi:hypothetical protein
MALIGVGIAVQPGNAGHPGTAAGYMVLGSILAAAFVFMIVGRLTTRLIVTEHGLTWRNFLRTRSIARMSSPTRQTRSAAITALASPDPPEPAP